VQTTIGLVDPKRTSAEKSAAAKKGCRHREPSPTSALDQLGMLLQPRPSSVDAALASFQRNIIPQLDSAYNFARLLSRNAEAAEEIVEEVFLRAYQTFAEFRGGDARTWILSIVRSCYTSWLTRQRRRARLEADKKGEPHTGKLISNISSDEDPPDALVHKAQSQSVRLVLSRMPRPLREILVLRELEELSYRQISDITALPIGTVMARLARARTAFGDAWTARNGNKTIRG
jgi:RNA polymerase sigma factor (sigma-70 family)